MRTVRALSTALVSLALLLLTTPPSPGAASPEAQTSPPSQAAQPSPEGNPATGRALFIGAGKLSAGGPACIGCHNAEGLGALEGGTWGLDLTKAHSKFGAVGLTAMLRNPSFPGMKEAFANRQITDQEVADLVAFLRATDQEHQEAGMVEGNAFPLLGLGAFVLMAAVSQLVWRGRLRKVREPMVRRRRR